MTVYYDQKRQKWRYDFRLNGRRLSGYCLHPNTRKEAQNRREATQFQELWRDKHTAEDIAIAKSGVTVGFTLAQALAEYLTRADEENRSVFNNEDYALEVIRHFGEGRLLADIDADDILRFRTELSKTNVKVYVGGPAKGGAFKETDRLRSSSTVNKYLLALETAWLAAERRHRAKIPDFPACPEIPYLATEEHLPNPVASADVAKILDVAPFHLAVTIILAVHTSMRLDEIARLTWREVKFELKAIHLPARRVKSKKARVVKLTATALSLLQWLREIKPADQDRVVLYWKQGFGIGTPRPFDSVATSWRTALRNAGVAHHRFHDLRGAMATHLADKVAPVPLQKWLGHADIATTMRYISIAEGSQQESADLAESYKGTVSVVDRLQATSTPIPSTREEARRYTGVYLAGRNRYQATIAITEETEGVKTKKVHYLGSFDTAQEAARAYDVAAKKLPGRKLNFPNLNELPAKKSHTAIPTQEIDHSEDVA